MCNKCWDRLVSLENRRHVLQAEVDALNEESEAFKIDARVQTRSSKVKYAKTPAPDSVFCLFCQFSALLFVFKRYLCLKRLS